MRAFVKREDEFRIAMREKSKRDNAREAKKLLKKAKYGFRSI